jgi:Holliday junction resolvase RusA-like endonuclease
VNVLRFVVPGEPVGASRPRATRIGDHARVYMPSKDGIRLEALRVLQEREDWHNSAGALFGRGIPLALHAVFYFSRPKSHYGTGRNADRLKVSAPFFHTARPDLDNCVKLLKDALNGLVVHDDSQLAVYAGAEKRYADGEPATAVTVGLAASGWEVVAEERAA